MAETNLLAATKKKNNLYIIFEGKKIEDWRREIGDRRLTLRHQEEGIGHGRGRRDQELVLGI